VKILIDTNVIFSAILFPNSNASKVITDVSIYHTLYLCDQNIFELKEIVKKKIPEKTEQMNTLLKEMSFTIIPAVTVPTKLIRDESDIPILNAAIKNNIDIIITGDKDFLEASIDNPVCMTISEYTKLFLNNSID